MRLCFAGEPRLLAQACSATAHPNILISYLVFRGKRTLDPGLRAMFEPERMILDSGLFSFMFGALRGQIPETFDAYRDFTRRYLDDVARIGWPGIVVEADVHKLLGMEALYRLREEFAPLGDRVMYVWHQPEGIDGLRELARARSYIALSIPELRIQFGGTHRRGTDSYKRAMWALLREAHAACKVPPRIHLLGCTVPELMQTPLAWSCDSTSWLSASIYGTPTWVYRGHGELVSRTRKDDPEWLAFRAAVAARTATPAGYQQTMIACADAFAQYQRWLDTRFNPGVVRTRGEDR